MTNNPLFNTILASGDITKQANPQVMDWTTTKSKVLTELKKKLPKPKQSRYFCNMIIFDDVFAPPPTSKQKESMLKWYQDCVDSRILSAFRIPESAVKGSIKGSALFNEANKLFDKSVGYTLQFTNTQKHKYE